MLTEEYLVSIFVLIILISIFYYKYIRTTSTFPNLEGRNLPHHTEKSFWRALRLSAKEHGYGGLFPSIRFLIRRFVNHNLQLVARVIPYSGLRIILHRMRGVKISRQVHIGPLVTIDDVYPDYVVIEEGASIAGSNYILTHTKPLSYHKNLMESHVAPVIIKENAWVAVGSIILPGVTVGTGSIVAAGSVVTKDVPDNVMVAGVPAKIIREFGMDSGVPVSLKKVNNR